jgi:hypothetical protein
MTQRSDIQCFGGCEPSVEPTQSSTFNHMYPQMVLMPVQDNTQGAYPMALQQQHQQSQPMTYVAVPTAVYTPPPASMSSSMVTSVAPRVIASVLSKIVNWTVDVVLGDEYTEYNEIYDELNERLDGNKLFKGVDEIRLEHERKQHMMEMARPRKDFELFGNPHRVPNNPVEAAMMEADEVKRGILTSLENIEMEKQRLLKLQEKSRCGLCKATLGDVANRVEDTVKYAAQNTHQIIDATDKVVAMQELKSRGRIERTKRWEDLTDVEKELVRQTIIDLNGPDYYHHVYDTLATKFADVDNDGSSDDVDAIN